MRQQRNIVVIGASSGGIETISYLLGKLPGNVPASFFIVQHQAGDSGELAGILQNHTHMPVRRVDKEEVIQLSHVYVAPPKRHMILDGSEKVRAIDGPRENLSRPAINPLFRTAANAYGSSVIGILLTGRLNDGVAGLYAIKRCGGLVIVQNPDKALYPDMPRNAIAAVDVDQILSVAEIADRLPILVTTPAPAINVPPEITIEARRTGSGHPPFGVMNGFAENVQMACPEFGEALSAMGSGETDCYRCSARHAFSLSVLRGQPQDLEQSLWAAVRALTERGTTLNKLADTAQEGSAFLAKEFRDHANEVLWQAEQVRQFLLSLSVDVPWCEQPEEDRDNLQATVAAATRQVGYTEAYNQSTTLTSTSSD